MTSTPYGLPAVNRGWGSSHPPNSCRPVRCLDPRSGGRAGSQQRGNPGPGSPLFISDTHFNHENIIRYCHRPFKSVRQMNTTLIKNWNDTVGPEDLVFHVGDLAKGAKPLLWLRPLNGHIVFIRGSHDQTGIPLFVLHYHGLPFLIIHNPAHAPWDWPGWVIHGHIHNNDMEWYPFINHERRTVNVSAELVDYTPVSLGEIEEAITNETRQLYVSTGNGECRERAS